MNQKLYVSNDDGAIYQEKHLDKPIDVEYYWAIEVPSVIILTPKQLCCGNNDIADMLIKARVAKKCQI